MRQAGDDPEGITAAASMQPAAKTVICGAPPPTFTATGSITSPKGATVTYYWALSDGGNRRPPTLTFTAPGTMAVHPWTVSPHTDPASGEAVLVVASPAAVASSPANYSLSCSLGAGSQFFFSFIRSSADAVAVCAHQPGKGHGELHRGAAGVHLYRHDHRQPGDDGQLLLEASQRKRPGPLAYFSGAGTRTVNADTFTPAPGTEGGSG